MPVFEYKALDGRGKEVKGVIDADSSASARGKLRSRGLYPSAIDIVSQKTGTPRGIGGKTVRSRELAVFMRQFSTLLNAGLPLSEALSALLEQTEHVQLKKTVSHLRDRVMGGASLSSAMEESSSVFSSLQVNMVRAGETSGGLEVVLERQAELLEKRTELMQRVKSALTYPAFMFVIGVAVLFFLMTFVVPRVTSIFHETAHILPLPTVLLMSFASFMQKGWWFIILCLTVCIVLWIRYIRTENGRKFKDRLVLRLPLWGVLQVKLIVVRITRTLATLLSSNVPMLSSLTICRAVAGNVVFEEALDAISDAVESGKGLANPLKGTGVFPPMAVHMIQSGERSGRLEEMMMRVSEMYEKEVTNSVNAMTSLLEPVMILVMGLTVGFVVLAILLPILEMSQLVH